MRTPIRLYHRFLPSESNTNRVNAPKLFGVMLGIVMPGMLLGGTLFPQFALASHTPEHAVCQNVPGNDCENASDPGGTVDQLTTTITDILTAIIASVSVLALVVAGFMYILSAGNPDSINRAKNVIIYSLVGIAVAAFAQVIVRFVLSSL